jgi:hypothetical protein
VFVVSASAPIVMAASCTAGSFEIVPQAEPLFPAAKIPAIPAALALFTAVNKDK